MKALSSRRQASIYMRIMIHMALLLMAQWTILSYGASAASTLAITLAKWESGDNLLDALGTGPALTTISIENAVTGSQLGSARSNREGNWTFKQQLSTAPCSIRVKAGRESAIKAVSGSPSNCDGSQSQAATLSGIAVTGLATINESTSAQYTCTAVYSDNSSRNVTETAVWSENSSTTTISAGNLAAGSVSSDRTVTVSASFGGKTASYNVTIKNIVVAAKTLSGLTISGPSSMKQGTTAAFTATTSYSDGTSAAVTPVWSENSTYATINASGVLTAATVTTNQNVTVTANYTSGGVSAINTKNVTITAATVSNTSKSINSTSRNRATLPAGTVAEQPFVNQSGFKVFGVNDLGMHCGDLDHRVASIASCLLLMCSTP
ncbi:MAG: hypothetical protein WBN77_04400 [Desulfobacterales bacterium]|uniref:BIG2 domain-containing protein n=1 Tax=uncultured Desulfobacterium sp. TaxID=201089 RepID=E1YCJ8_9BACT|nr:hypothetical protein N47_G36160 [uncultured Desulfobacterium sp.]